MKRTQKSSDLPPLLAFGAHPDDVEFGCGAVIANETLRGRKAHLVICSRGESASHGTPARRMHEAKQAAKVLGASVEWLELDGDARLEIRAAHAIKLAGTIRRLRPGIVLAPTVAYNQHPDHARLGKMVRDASRLARYGGLNELNPLPAHAIELLLFYAVTPEAEPAGHVPLLIDVSSPKVMARWKAAMAAHASQVRNRKYVELQLTRARLHGLRASVEYAAALFPGDAVVLESLAQITHSARQF